MSITVLHLTNKAYGFPSRGAVRRVKPIALICIHITGNAKNVGAAAATNERNYANRADSPGPSAHTYLNRDGSGIEAISTKFAAWSNGITRSPNTKNAGINAVLALKAKGYNPNECYVREVECVGHPTGYPVTAAQQETLAQLIAADAKASGLPINRNTVHTHADIDSEQRPNCAFPPAAREARLASIIKRANEILHPVVAVPPPAPAPVDATPYSEAQMAADRGELAAEVKRRVAAEASLAENVLLVKAALVKIVAARAALG